MHNKNHQKYKIKIIKKMHNKEVDILNRDFKFRLYDNISKHYYDNDVFDRTM